LRSKRVRVDELQDGDRILAENAIPPRWTPPLAVLGNPNGTPRPDPSWPVWIEIGPGTSAAFMPDDLVRIYRG
jgi:hypothetical protein